MPVPDAAVQHYQAMQRTRADSVRAALELWASMPRRRRLLLSRRGQFARIINEWADRTRELTPAVAGLQSRAALDGATYGALTLAQQGTYVAPTVFADPAAFAGVASDGRPLDGLLQTVAFGVAARMYAGMALAPAMDVGAALLERLAATIIADAGRQAAGVDIVARPQVGYVRMLNPPSCSRCAILAGKWFRWNAGFLRHPNCDCVHVPSTAGSLAAAKSEGLIADQYEYFNSLSESEQDDVFGKADAQAIRDGADMNQVVNAHRGMTRNGNFTSEGTLRGWASQNLKPGQKRMTPELIYNMAGSREEALELLRHHGYLLGRGQVPNVDMLRREGYGQMGAGGRRRAASEAVERARQTGVRDPNSRYTMTAAERRLYDARRAYEIALSGVSPYTSPGFGNTPDPYGLRLNRVGASTRPVTPRELALAERHYRRMLATGGQIFSR